MNDCVRDLQYYIIVNKSTNYIIMTDTVLAESAILYQHSFSLSASKFRDTSHLSKFFKLLDR